jgi:hypothetical protein
MRRTLRAVWLRTSVTLGLVLGAATASHAAPIVVDFDAAAPGILLTVPYVEDGVTMSVITGHYDIFVGVGGNFGNIDNVGGPSQVSLSMGGTPFTLVSIEFPSPNEFGTLTASNGAVVPIATGSGGVINFNLPGITSFTLAHGQTFLGFDDVTLETAAAPEPSLLLLLGAGLAAFRRSLLHRGHASDHT